MKQKELEMHIEKLKKTIHGLKNKEDLTEKVSALESTIQDRQNVIGKKNLEMSRLMDCNCNRIGRKRRTTTPFCLLN